MSKPFHFSALILILFLWNSCSSYKPHPIDIRRDTDEWRQVSQEFVGSSKQLTWEQMRSIGLFLNADLNKARLTFLKSRSTAKYAGLWDDPSLAVSGARYLKGMQYDRSASLGLTIPVSGRTVLARKVAQMYSDTDLMELKATESDYLMRLHALYYTIQITHSKHELMRERVNQASEELASIAHLAEAGETNIQELHNATQRRNDLLKQLQELENEHLNKHLELVSMLGLHPAVGAVEVVGSLPQSVPKAIPAPTAEALLQHPRLQAAMYAYQTSEQELRLEIRKQYPDISLSPGFEHEEGNNKLALEFGFTLPLWNRNREAIARAHGARELGRHSAIQQWRELVQQAYALNLRQLLALKHCQTEFDRLTAMQETSEAQENLYRMGEIDLPTLAGTRHETFSRRLAYLDCLAELIEIQVALQTLSSPE